MKNKPFIKLFNTRYGNYIYDVNTNSVLTVKKETYDCLSKIMKSNELDESLYNEELINLEKQGYLKSKRPDIIELPETDNIEYYLTHRLQKLTLQVTQQCNFRCRYCHYTYGDDTLYHSHKSASMSWETAKEAIDFFAERTRDTKYVNIGFYGGEPLLKYDLIQKCIDYGNKVFEGKILSYALTTNGALLTVERTKYLIDNNVSILVSLDGPKEIHDKNRKLAIDGSGTFDLVYSNLEEIKETIPEYFSRISFNSVVDPSLDCSQINNFFACDLFKLQPINTTALQPTVGKGVYFSNEYVKNSKKSLLLAMLSQVGVFDAEELPKIAFNHYISFSSFNKQMNRFFEVPDRMGHSGPCKPGIFRLFVSIDGGLYPCERLKDTSDVMKIGTLNEGFDFEKVKYIYNVGYVCTDRCKNCWNIRHCKICATKINDGQCLSKELCAYECKYDTKLTEENLRQYMAISEVKKIIMGVN